MKNSAENTEVILYAYLQTKGGVFGKWAAIQLQKVETFEYLGMVFTCDEGGAPGDWYTDWIGKANAVLRELYRSVATKRELSNTVKLSVFKSIFVPILSYDHESWVMTERILTQVQTPKLGFLRRVHGVTQGRTEVRLRSGKDTSLAPPYLNLSFFGSKYPALKKKLATLLRIFGGAQWFGVRGIVFASLRPWCDISRQSAQLWNWQCPHDGNCVNKASVKWIKAFWFPASRDAVTGSSTNRFNLCFLHSWIICCRNCVSNEMFVLIQTHVYIKPVYKYATWITGHSKLKFLMRTA